MSYEPRPGRARRAVTDAERASWARPWAQLKYFTYSPAVYDRFLAGASPDAKPGDLVTVYDPEGRIFATGFLNPRAHVPLRVLAHGTEPADETRADAAVVAAARLRVQTLGLDAETDAYRVVNADGDRLPGLVVDRYGDTLCAVVTNLGAHRRLARWLDLLHAELGTKRHVVRIDPDIARIENMRGQIPDRDPPRSVRIRENGVRHEVDFEEGHKTGFFCDQRDNRRRLARYVRGARVLDLCCYTGGFSVTAKTLGAADEVTGVDLDEDAIEQAKRNANLNQARVSFIHADAFGWCRQMQKNGERWDVVVLDPPKFVHGRDDVVEGRKRYEDLNFLGIGLTKPGGFLVTCSCSGLLPEHLWEESVVRSAHRQERKLQFLERTGAGLDHPVLSNAPEGRYLKVLWARVLA